MANVNNISSNSYSSTSSIYGNRNVLTGLASGMDTEAMIQNSVTGYQTKITQLQQSQTKVEWKQDAYRDLIDQMQSISMKYTSFSSKTNLASNGFFTSNVTTTANGDNAEAVSATGVPKSDVKINAVTQLATAARYAVDASALDVRATEKAAGDAIDWANTKDAGQVKGSLTLKYGSQDITLDFDEKDNDINTIDALRDKIVEKLGEVQIKAKDGGTIKASRLFNVEAAENGTITFSVDRSSSNDDGSALYISSFSGNLGTTLGVQKANSSELSDKFSNTSFTVGNVAALVKSQSAAEYLSGKTVDVTLDGTTKQIKLGDLTGKSVKLGDTTMQLSEAVDKLKAEDTAYDEKQSIREALTGVLRDELQESIDKAFGSGKLTVGTQNGGLKFDVAPNSGSTVKVSSSVGEMMGIGTSGVSNYFNTSQSLGNLIDKNWLNANARTAVDAAAVTSRGSGDDVKYYDAENKLVKKDDDGNWYRTDSDGNWLYSMKINGATIDGLTKDSTLESVLNKINSNPDAGVNVSYSNLTSQFVFTARETGAAGNISFDSPLAQKLFGVSNAPKNKTLGDMFGDDFGWDENGNLSFTLRSIAIGSEKLGTFNKNDSLDKLMTAMNSAAGGLHNDWFSYDAENDSYVLKNARGEPLNDNFAALIAVGNSTDVTRQLDFKQLAERANSTGASGVTKTAGQDAVINATVNGKDLTLRRASNVVDMDGMKVTLKKAFTTEEGGEAVSFTSKSDGDTIVEAVKSFVTDINKLMNDVHSAYTTQPLKKGTSKNSSGYDPLTEEDKKDMSESAVAAYEEKAKTGLLFGDTDLSQLYGRLLNAIQSFGSDRVDMDSIGLKTTYSNGVTTISLDESKLRAALDSDPDKVRNVFAKTKDGGSATDGLMSTLKTTLNAYSSTSLGSQGILVRKAGTKLSSVSLLNNTLQKQIDNFTKQIESWQDKLSDKIDYYTKQFTQLEKLMSTMNNQSSMLSDLMGY